MKSFVEDVSPALLATIESEFEKVAKMDPPQPTKGDVDMVSKAHHPSCDVMSNFFFFSNISLVTLMKKGVLVPVPMPWNLFSRV